MFTRPLVRRSRTSNIGALAAMAVAIISGYVIISARASVALPADINGDGKVDVFDLSRVLSDWGKTGASDISGNGKVDIFDLSLVLSNWGKSTTASPTPTSTASATPVSTDTPTPSTTASAGSLNLPRIPWEGGPSYWSPFAKAKAGGWTNPNFFPISVFLGKADPTHLTSLKDAGVNTYMAVEHSPSILPLSNLTNAGMFAMPQQGEWTQAEVGSNPNAVGWFISDECDQGEGECWLNGDASKRLPLQNSWINTVKAYNDGRFTQANFGNGILRTFWADDMASFVQGVDAASADKYTYTSPDVDAIVDGVHDAPDWPNGVPVARAYSYGWQADQMRRFQNGASLHPVWTFVETARPYLNETNARVIQPDQIEGAVWSALIHEARGIAYFQHNNSSTGCTANYSIVECPTVHAKVKAINTQVQALAPVLNTQSYYNATRVVNGFTYYQYSFNNGTDTMLKTYGGSAYIFAGLGMHCSTSTCAAGSADTTGNKIFTLPAGVNGTTVTVVGEGRTIPVSGGKFTDSFAAEYTHHIYQISL